MHNECKKSCILVLLAVIILFGCVSQQQYREKLKVEHGPNFCKEDTAPTDCETAIAIIKKGQPSYFLGIVEFDDSGLLFDPKQLDFVIENLKFNKVMSSDYKGTILVVFAHGWTHNAAPDDGNLKYFESLLQTLADDEKKNAIKDNRFPRFVQGVYLAWRGQSLPGPLHYFTFYNRKDTAHRIGEREATQTLLRLREVAYDLATQPSLNETNQRPNRFIVVGHSFGGALVFSAVSQLISYELIYPTRASSPPLLADSLILINPAFEAGRVLPLFQTLTYNNTSRPTIIPRPKLAIFTSDNDKDTKRYFVWPRFVSTVFNPIFGTSYRKVENPLRQKLPAREDLKISQQDADTRSIGHFDPLVTHFLVSSDRIGKLVGCSQKVLSDEEIQKKLQYTYSNKKYDYLDFGETCLVVADPKYINSETGPDLVPGFEKNLERLEKQQLAIFNVKVNKEIWDGHGLEENNKMFLTFLKKFIPFSTGEIKF